MMETRPQLAALTYAACLGGRRCECDFLLKGKNLVATGARREPRGRKSSILLHRVPVSRSLHLDHLEPAG
jgi:hypothetical protein